MSVFAAVRAKPLAQFLSAKLSVREAVWDSIGVEYASICTGKHPEDTEKKIDDNKDLLKKTLLSHGEPDFSTSFTSVTNLSRFHLAPGVGSRTQQTELNFIEKSRHT